jgi:hypothetical protein
MDSSAVSGGIYGWKEITEFFRDFKDLLSRLHNWWKIKLGVLVYVRLSSVCVGEEISGRVAECTHPKSYDEEGPKRFACYGIGGRTHKNMQEFRVVRTTGA